MIEVGRSWKWCGALGVLLLASTFAGAAVLFEGERKTDVFVSYCTNAVATARLVPGLTWQRMPAAIDIAAVYGAGVSTKASAAAESFLRFLESADGHAILERYGFQ